MLDCLTIVGVYARICTRVYVCVVYAPARIYALLAGHH